jgi:ABC-type uncharacterized transport system involved in gliding motility auxiliary subunit
MEHLKNRKLLTGGILLIAAVLFFVLNISFGTLFKSWRLDLTDSKIYTLAPGTKQIIQDLDEPVILRFYFSKKLPNINPYIISFASRVEDLLMQYQRSSRGKVIVEVIDPEPFSAAEDAAVNYGLQGVPIDNSGTEFYLGLVGTNSLNTRQVIPFLQPNREQNIEYDISQLIYKLANPQPRVVGVMSSLPLEGNASMRPWALWQQMEQLFRLQSIDYNADEIPADISTLMIVEPSTFTKEALRAIDKFVMRGGHILAFVDPVSEVTDARTAYQNQTRQKSAGNYLELLKAWGVDFNDEKIVADRVLAKSVRVPNNGREVSIRYPFWMDFVTSNFDQNDVLSASLERVTLATPGILRPEISASTKFTPLITTTDQALETDASKLQDYQQNLGDFINKYTPAGAYTVAARISGPIKSPYSDSSVTDSNIIIIADTDMLHDHFWINVQNLMGQEYAMPNASNGNLVLSALDNLSGSNALISIRNRGTFMRPFETIRALELKSEQKYRESEQELQQKLEFTKQKLEQLETIKKDGNKGVVTARQKQEEDAFRQELVETRRELRDVRRKLNQDIESLTTGVKFFSIGFIPMLIMFGGLTVWGLQIQRDIKSRRAACSTPRP